MLNRRERERERNFFGFQKCAAKKEFRTKVCILLMYHM
jgi:hypothetical protein